MSIWPFFRQATGTNQHKLVRQSDLNQLAGELSQWLLNSQNQQQAQLKELVQEATSLALQQLVGELVTQGISGQTGISAASTGDSHDRLTEKSDSFGIRGFSAQSVLGSAIKYGWNEWIDQSRTRTNSQESERSQQGNAAFRLSRSQQAAEWMRQLEKGQRNA